MLLTFHYRRPRISARSLACAKYSKPRTNRSSGGEMKRTAVIVIPSDTEEDEEEDEDEEEEEEDESEEERRQDEVKSKLILDSTIVLG
jgi:TATA-binding protein-associated factor Taf7